MTAAELVALISALAGLVTAVTALVHSIQTRKAGVALADSMARAAIGSARTAPRPIPPRE
jgi:hypothetical protein